MEEELEKNTYIIIRYIEGICIAVFIFGLLWNGADVLQLTFPQFMMLYGGLGAVVSEFIARLMAKQLKKKEKE